MSLILKLPQILGACRKQYEEERENRQEDAFSCLERVKRSESQGTGDNVLAYGDNVTFMQFLLQRGFAGKLKLIYIDPPFYSKANYEASVAIPNVSAGDSHRVRQRAYKDVWENGMEGYLSMMALRLFYMRELLADDGSIWVHLDWHVVHYVKVLMDEIFGEGNFINEVIWTYKSGGVNKRHFARKHDTLLYYGKTKDHFFKPVKEKSYNRGLKPYRFKGVEEFQDKIGWYTMVNKKDVWQIDMVGRTSRERTGYATQKPEQLLKQILESCTEENDYCADFFCGSGTTAAAAASMGRRFLTCDTGKLAVSHTYRRLAENGAEFSFFADMVQQTRDMTQENEDTAQQLDGSINGSFQWKGDSGYPELKLEDYVPASMDPLDLPGKDRRELESIMEENSMRLLVGGSVGIHRQDGVYEPEFFFKATEDGHIICEGWAVSEDHRCSIAAIITDVFGNRMEVMWK